MDTQPVEFDYNFLEDDELTPMDIDQFLDEFIEIQKSPNPIPEIKPYLKTPIVKTRARKPAVSRTRALDVGVTLVEHTANLCNVQKSMHPDSFVVISLSDYECLKTDAKAYSLCSRCVVVSPENNLPVDVNRFFLACESAFQSKF